MTTYFSDIFNMTKEIVSNTDNIVDMMILVGVLTIVNVLILWISGLFRKVGK